MTRTRIVGAVLLVVLGAGLLTRITNQAGTPPNRVDHLPVEILAVEGQPVREMVDLRNGNLRVEIPIRSARQKTAAPRSGH